MIIVQGGMYTPLVLKLLSTKFFGRNLNIKIIDILNMLDHLEVCFPVLTRNCNIESCVRHGCMTFDYRTQRTMFAILFHSLEQYAAQSKKFLCSRLTRDETCFITSSSSQRSLLWNGYKRSDNENKKSKIQS